MRGAQCPNRIIVNKKDWRELVDITDTLIIEKITQYTCACSCNTCHVTCIDVFTLQRSCVELSHQ